MSDAIDELARRLFEAARHEGPDAQLVARLQNAGPAAARPAERADPESGSHLVRLPQRHAAPPRGRHWRWLAVAAVLAGAALLAFGRGPASPNGNVNISAEAQPAARPNAARAPAPELDPPPAFESAAAPKEMGPTAVPLKDVAPPTAAPARSLHPRDRSPQAAPEAPPRAEPPPPPRVAPAPSAPLSAQLELLKRARSLLRAGDGAGALEAIERYGSELHGTDLKDEAEVLRIEALSALGRKGEATALARRFVTEHPDSPLAERAQRFSVDPGATPAPAGEP